MPLDIGAKRVLLLQGPNGPFFRRLANELRAGGVEVTKVNFNPGDSLFYRGPDVFCFRQPLAQWPEFFRALVAERQTDAVMLFGDCRPLHKEATRIANELGIAVWAFEEGYLRPNHITLERGGVNGNSSMPAEPDFYRRATMGLPEQSAAIHPVGHTMGYWAWHGTAYSIATTLLRWWRYPHYQHHRDSNMWRHTFYGVRATARKYFYAMRERGMLKDLTSQWSGKYFFVPLQVHCDSQLEHAPFESLEQFIEKVIRSFSENAASDTLLVFKHHPADRGYREYGSFLRELGAKYGCKDRIVYVHDLHLPTLLKNARATVTMNSTVGLSSLYHGTPVKALGLAVYNMPGLTFQGDLASYFSSSPISVDSELVEAFRRWLLETNQINGSFYKRAPGLSKLSGLGGFTAPNEILSPMPQTSDDTVAPAVEPTSVSRPRSATV